MKPTTRKLFECIGKTTLDIDDLADIVETDRMELLSVLRGKWTPDPEVQEKLAAVFGVQVHEIFGD